MYSGSHMDNLRCVAAEAERVMAERERRLATLGEGAITGPRRIGGVHPFDADAYLSGLRSDIDAITRAHLDAARATMESAVDAGQQAIVRQSDPDKAAQMQAALSDAKAQAENALDSAFRTVGQ